jgi:hypothetical protein
MRIGLIWWNKSVLCWYWSTIVKMRSLIINAYFSISTDFVLWLWPNVWVILLVVRGTVTSFLFLVYLRLWVQLGLRVKVWCTCQILNFKQVRFGGVKFKECFLKLGYFSLESFFLFVNSFELIESVIIDGFKLLAGLFFVFFHFILQLIILLL